MINTPVETRVAWPFKATFTIAGIPGEHRARVLEIGEGGMQIATDMLLRSEWTILFTFTMPSQVLDVLDASDPFAHLQARRREAAFGPLTLASHVAPGVHESRAHYVHAVRFINADRVARSEIARFVYAVKLSKRRLAF